MELLYRALNTEHGIVIATEDPDRFRQRLYREIQKDPALACISVVQSRTNPAGELWLVRKGDKNEPEEP